MKRTKISRRHFLKSFTVGFAATSFSSRILAASSQSTQKPNVVFILTDDQGTVDVNCYGAKDLITPNLDALAA